MEFYDYKGIKEGKYTECESEAVNKDEAAYKLRGLKIIITRLEESKKKSSVEDKKKVETKTRGTKSKIPPKEILITTKALATMVKAGLPVLDAIGMAKEQVSNKKFIPIMNEIYKRAINIKETADYNNIIFTFFIIIVTKIWQIQ